MNDSASGALTRRELLAWGALAIGSSSVLRADTARRAFVDDAGRSVILPSTVRRVFAAGKPAAVLLAALAPETLLGWSRSLTAEERAFLPESLGTLPEVGILTGRSGSASAETVLALRPDLIVDYGSLSSTSASLADRIQEQTRIPYLLLDGRLTEAPRVCAHLGAAIGRAEEGAALGSLARETLDPARARVAKVGSEARPRLYFARGPKGLETGLEGSINLETFEVLGVANIAARELGRGGLVTVSAEQVLAWDPEVIVATDASFARSAASDPLWRSVSAVRTGRLHLAPMLPFGWIDSPPSVNRLLGLHWLATVLFPREPTEDLRPIVRELYRRLYHRAPDEAQLTGLLATSRVTARRAGR